MTSSLEKSGALGRVKRKAAEEEQGARRSVAEVEDFLVAALGPAEGDPMDGRMGGHQVEGAGEVKYAGEEDQASRGEGTGDELGCVIIYD